MQIKLLLLFYAKFGNFCQDSEWKLTTYNIFLLGPAGNQGDIGDTGKTGADGIPGLPGNQGMENS